MTPDKLKHLATRAASGELTADEQWEYANITYEAFCDLFQICFSEGLSTLTGQYEKLMNAARLPERVQCEACGGKGSKLMRVQPWLDAYSKYRCPDCNGTGYQSPSE